MDARTSYSAQHSPASLLRLPVQVIGMVFASVDNVQDAASLCLTNQLLSIVGRNYVHRLAISTTASWVGDHIILVDGRKTVGASGFAGPGSPGHQTVMEAVSRTFKRVGQHVAAPQLDWKFTRRLSAWEEQKFWELTHGHRDDSKQSRVLCNLSKRQYVREDMLAHGLATVGAATADIGLVPSMLSLIRHTGGVQGETLNVGVWAVDRFEITSWGHLVQKRDGREWTDVSREVVHELKVLASHLK